MYGEFDYDYGQVQASLPAREYKEQGGYVMISEMKRIPVAEGRHPFASAAK